MSKTYFLAPTRDSPPTGPISLGSIISSPRFPELSLNGKNSPALKALQIEETSVSDASRQLVKTGKGKAGVWAEFLGGIGGIGGDTSGNWDNNDIALYKFQELITRTISPDTATVKTLFDEPAIQQSIRDSRFRANLYMITGVKIARGADVAISKIRANGGNLYFGVDATAAGVPIKMGPDFSTERAVGQGLTEHHNSDFVFAYRLRELVYKRKVFQQQKEYAKGDIMGVGEGKEEKQEEDDGTKGEIELSGLNGEDLQAEDWELDAKPAADDDGEDCVCVIVGEDE